MKNYGIRGFLLLLVALLPASCIKDDYAASEKASVTMTFTTRAPSGLAVPDILPGEGMKHLRVIVADQVSGEIRFNYTHEFEDDQTSTKVTFGDLYAGHTYDFYAIANEQSFDGDFSNPDLTQLSSMSLDVDASSLIGNSNHLPASAKKTMQVQADENQSLAITLHRVVAKANVTFINETGTSQTVSDVRLLKIGGANTPLFPKGDPDLKNYVPDVSASENIALGNVTLGAGASSSLVGYFYESKETDGYVLQATWNGETRQFKLTEMEGGSVIKGYILRNQQLNINILLKKNGLSLEVQVNDWNDGGSFDMSYGEAFNGGLELLSGNPKVTNENGEAYAVTYGNESSPGHDLTFNLGIDQPVAATWTANLTNGSDFEVVKTEDNAAATGYIDGKPVSITIRPKGFDPNNPVKETELYITLTLNGQTVGDTENHGEQLINSGNKHPGTITRIKIRQIAPSDWPQP